MAEEIMKLSTIKLFRLCAKLDALPFKCSDDMEKFEYLFNNECRYILFGHELPLTYYNKTRAGYGLRKNWREIIFNIDELQNFKNREKIETMVMEHTVKMEELEQKKKEQKKKEKQSLKSRYTKGGTIVELDEEAKNILLRNINMEYITKWKPYLTCAVCGFQEHYDGFKIGRRAFCIDCMELVVAHSGLSYYHAGKTFKKEELIMDIQKVLKEKQYVENIKEIVKFYKKKSNAEEAVTERYEDYGKYEEEGEVVYYLKPKGIQYEDREAIIKRMDSKSFVWFKREPDNPYDKCAIGIWTIVRDKEEHIGYVSASISSELAAVMDNGEELIPTIDCFFTEELRWKEPYMVDGITEWEENHNVRRNVCLLLKYKKQEV